MRVESWGLRSGASLNSEPSTLNGSQHFEPGGEVAEDGGLVHLAMIAMKRPPGKCRAAHHSSRSGPSGLPVPAREEAQEREHEDHDKDDPENAHAVSLPPFGLVDLLWLISATEQRRTGTFRYGGRLRHPGSDQKIAWIGQ